MQEGGGRAAASTKTGEKKEEPVIIGFWCWYVEKSQFPVQCGGGKRGEHLWQLHCGMVGIWSGITSKIAWNILYLQREEGLVLPCFGKWRRAKCGRHSIAESPVFRSDQPSVSQQCLFNELKKQKQGDPQSSRMLFVKHQYAGFLLVTGILQCSLLPQMGVCPELSAQYCSFTLTATKYPAPGMTRGCSNTRVLSTTFIRQTLWRLP